MKLNQKNLTKIANRITFLSYIFLSLIVIYAFSTFFIAYNKNIKDILNLVEFFGFLFVAILTLISAIIRSKIPKSNGGIYFKDTGGYTKFE